MLNSRLPASARVTLLKALGGGYTDAEVSLCDIDGVGDLDGHQLDGQFVLKVAHSTGKSQANAHQAFVAGLETFASDHVPSLIYSVADAGISVDVYDVAGYSLESARSAERVDFEDRTEICGRAAGDLLRDQIATAGPPNYRLLLHEVMHQWLGSGFPSNRRGARIAALLAEQGWSDSAFTYEGELLPNPLKVLSRMDFRDGELACFEGAVHGDLHLRNILVCGSALTNDLRYWLIDVDKVDPTPLLFDHAYLELSLLVHGMNTLSAGRIVPVLSRLDSAQAVIQVDLDGADSGLVRQLRSVREAATATLEELEPKRPDVWRRQYLLARVAAGLDWAAKPLDSADVRRACIISAAWALRLLLREFYPPLWLAVAGGMSAADSRQTPDAKVLTAAEAVKLWTPFRDAHSSMDLILIADRVSAAPELAALARGRWTNVIDLDPDSDSTGLAHVMLAKLRNQRHVSLFGANEQPVSPVLATNWCMANGWKSHNEEGSVSIEDWRRKRSLHRVRALVDATYNGTPNQSVGVMCLRSGQHSPHIDQVVDYIDEVYGGIALRVDLAQAPAFDGFDLDVFTKTIAESLPPIVGPQVTLPGLNGSWRLSRVDLNRLGVDLELLHSEVIEEAESSIEPLTDEFWRGRTPTWAELAAAIDIRRDALLPLTRDIADRLDTHQLSIVTLDHSPGAGGTSLTRRVAWDLHLSHPTAILRGYSTTTADRIDEIYQETGLSAFIVAEAAILSESDREDLLQDLRQRNSRAVFLWINRTNVSRGRRHSLMDPLQGNELARFIREYRQRAETDRARHALDELRVGESGELVPASKLSPFYLGLLVYDEQFEGLVPYVRNHLQRLTSGQREVARHLALITRYGQGRGLPLALVRVWLSPSSRPVGEESDDALTELLGPDLRHLVVVENSSLRLLHPLIAEQVLDGIAGGEQPGLGQISVNFIRKVTSVVGPDSDTAARLLGELFIRRTSWSSDGRRGDSFSELIQAMPMEAAEMVFKELTDRCPNNPHFWNHRGRYHIYRVRGDFRRAEEYVQKAVEKSHGSDSTHFHTLGMVRRFWVENRIDELLRSDQGKYTPEAILSDISPLFDLAIEAFGEAGRRRGSEYAWVTPIQLIATVVEKLWRSSGEGSLVDFVALNSPASLWATKQIALAESLLSNLRDLDSEDDYYKKLNQQLDLLYGDVERLVEEWRRMREERSDSPDIDLAIARTLYSSAHRDWSLVSADDMRTIAQMAEGRVRDGRASDADLRLWFQSYRRLPEYTDADAMERLGWYATEKKSLDANYYMYILHFLTWYRGDARDQNRIRFFLEECSRLGKQERRQWSFEWLGVEGRSHPLVHYSELGTLRRGPVAFWNRPHELGRVSGIIEEIRSPQAGLVRVSNGKLRAFFTPRNKFRQSRDVNASIEFYLGFSYEGLRAWEPTYPGEEPDALKGADLDRVTRPVDRVAATVQAPPVEEPEDAVDESEPAPEPSPKARRFRIDPALLAALRSSRGHNGDRRRVVEELIEAAASAEVELPLLTLGEALQDILGPTGYKEFKADFGGKLRVAVVGLGFRVEQTDAGEIVRT
ncbi:hypothetical protein [Kribbella soli]|uniref:Aminoglycoside phosphotransferase domain-containing protein n=1 Tax=Kribbella soli TaxID=1124743 RepID=A0A4V2LXP2_9ACTN|nr:hypothetical protein [Kribbella soli]TCC01296.1 hypothetical protein E0H45_41955 [Kribbella soli]